MKNLMNTLYGNAKFAGKVSYYFAFGITTPNSGISRFIVRRSV